MNKKSIVVSVLALALLVCGGCSDRDTQVEQKGKSSETKTEKVNCLLDWKASMQNAAFYLAKSRGYYKDANLEVSISEGNGAPEATTLIGTGKYDVGISSGAATVMGIEKGLPVVGIAQMYQRTPTVIYSFADKGIKKPEDLYGKTIGINHDSINADEYRAFVAAAKLDKGKVKEVAISWGSESILTEKADALLDYADNEPVILEVKTGKEVGKLYLADYGVKTYGLNIITNRTYLKNHPDTVRRFLNATLRAWKELMEDPKRAAQEFGTLQVNRNLKADTLSAKVVAELCTSEDTKAHGLGYQTLQGWEDTVKTMRSLGLVKNSLVPETVFTNDFLPK